MPRGKKYSPEEIIPKLREAEVLMSQGMTQELAAKQAALAMLAENELGENEWLRPAGIEQDAPRPGRPGPKRAELTQRIIETTTQEKPAAATHKRPKVRRWLARHPRFHMHFIHTSSSWLNLVERFFAKLTNKRLRRGTFRSAPQLIQAIGSYVEHLNDHTDGYRWTAQTDAILAKAARAQATLDKVASE